ncbi:Uncharacterised protein g10664 [Pycnogonum litorale]
MSTIKVATLTCMMLICFIGFTGRVGADENILCEDLLIDYNAAIQFIPESCRTGNDTCIFTKARFENRRQVMRTLNCSVIPAMPEILRDNTNLDL